MKLRGASSLLAQFDRISISSISHRTITPLAAISFGRRPSPTENGTLNSSRSFSSSAIRAGDWLLPSKPEAKRSRKGRPRVPTGGSARGTTVVWGDYGLRMRDHHRRVSASQLKIGEEAIKTRLRGMRYRLYKRVCASIGVYSSGNEVCQTFEQLESMGLIIFQVRMGKGKGSFDHWASRIAVSKIIFELKGDVHEQVARDAFRIAAAKMPGNSRCGHSM